MPLLICPHCHVEMQVIKRENVEIDICTNCQGVWLDKGELEKILDIAKQDFEYEKEHGHTKNKNSKFWINLFNIFRD